MNSISKRPAILLALLCTFLGTLPGLPPAALAKKPALKKAASSAREATICRSPDFVKGIDFYNKHNCRDAIKNFELVDAHGGCCQWTHYYLGLCYQDINQVGMAYRQFEWVISHGTNPTLKRYAQFGCDTVTAYAANRTYAGQGGIMAAVAYSRSGSGAGCGSFG